MEAEHGGIWLGGGGAKVLGLAVLSVWETSLLLLYHPGVFWITKSEINEGGHPADHPSSRALTAGPAPCRNGLQVTPSVLSYQNWAGQFSNVYTQWEMTTAH